MAEFTLGSDAEVPLIDKNGLYRSAIGLIGGTKDNPKATKHGYVQEDNVLAEFNVNPASSRQEFVDNTILILNDLKDLIVPLDLSVDIKATALYEETQLEHPLAQAAGCEPDFDAWTVQVNEPPILCETLMRSCGGHLHIAFERAKKDFMSRVGLVKIMDLVAGAPSVLMDLDTDRRALYGKAGCHRPKMVRNNDPYDGVEYRTLSNFWLASKGTIGWAYDVVNRALDEFDDLLKGAEADQATIIEAINNSNKQAAQELVDKYNLEVVYA